MAYIPTDWKTGDIVSSEKLNKLEQGVVDAQNGYGVGNVIVTLLPQSTVTTQAEEEAPYPSAYVQYDADISGIDQETRVVVTFDGVDYEPTPQLVEGMGIVLLGDANFAEGTPDFTRYPFVISIEATGTTIITDTPKTITVSVTAAVNKFVVAEDFKRALGESITWLTLYDGDADLGLGPNLRDYYTGKLIDEGTAIELIRSGAPLRITYIDNNSQCLWGFNEAGATLSVYVIGSDGRFKQVQFGGTGE